MLVGSTSACSISSLPRTKKLSSSASPTKLTPPKHSVQIGDQVGELFHQRRQRTYLIHTPKSYKPNRPMPLVVALHGFGSQGKDLASSTGFSNLADQKGFIIVYPDGLNKRWDVASNPLFGVDDVSFVSALINQIAKIRAIDSRRIYVTGVSNGGFLVQRLACEKSSKIAAFSSVVANFPSELQSLCNPPRPISMLMINGTNDQKVPWSGTIGWILSVPDSIKFWLTHNNCNASLPVKQQRSKRVEISRSSCRQGSEVELVTLKGVGHVWPRGGSGSEQLLNGSQEIWDFFQRHPLSN